MGLERSCTVTLDGRSSAGKAHCGDGLLEFRGEFRISWKWQDLRIVDSEDGILKAVKGDQLAEFNLGDAEAKWKHAILNPKTWVDKMAMRLGQPYRIVGELEQELKDDLLSKFGTTTEKDAEVVFLRMESNLDLSMLDAARSTLPPNGAVWTIFPKGQKSFKDNDIRNYGRTSGWIDVKIASVTETLTSMKLVLRKPTQS